MPLPYTAQGSPSLLCGAQQLPAFFPRTPTHPTVTMTPPQPQSRGQ